MTQRYDYDFDAEATNNTAATIYRYAREHGPKVLDVGSGPAVVSSRLARELGFDVTCIDVDTDAIALARERGVGRTFVHDLTQQGWEEDVRGESFDLIVLADVLEHLPRPQEVLAAIRESALLAPGGRILLSMPNASHEMVISSLLIDDFRYTDVGVMDETHIRWFTMKSMQRLLQSQGYTIESSATITRTLEQTSHKHVRLDLDPSLRRVIREQVPHAAVYQYVFVVAPLDESRAALVARDDEVVREAGALSDAFLEEYAERKAALEALVEKRDAQVAELTALLAEVREHAERELQHAASEQARLENALAEARGAEKKSADVIRRQKREIAAAGPYLRGRRLAGRVKRRVRRALT